MATKKTKPAPRKKTSPRPAPRKAARASVPHKAASEAPLTAPQQAALLALDASYEEAINIPVSAILQEAREMQGLLKKLGKRILAKSRLKAALIDDLPSRIASLDGAERGWSSHRTLQLPTGKKKLRADAEELRSDAISALRHFVEDARVQARVDRIVEGSGLADLIDDLKKLKPLLDDHSEALSNADLPPEASEKLQSLADALEAAVEQEGVARAGSDEARSALHLRNRAYWWLREAMDEIRECARYVFRKSPAQARLFRSPYTTRHKKAAPKPAKPSLPPPHRPPPPAAPTCSLRRTDNSTCRTGRHPRPHERGRPPDRPATRAAPATPPGHTSATCRRLLRNAQRWRIATHRHPIATPVTHDPAASAGPRAGTGRAILGEV